MAFLFLARIVFNHAAERMIKTTGLHMSQDSEYNYLNESAFDEEVMKYHKPIIVEFGADWCGCCRIMAPIVNDILATYRDQLKVVKLDIDQNKHLVSKYGIQAKPTFLFIKNGKIVNHIIGSTSRKDFEHNIISLL
jgi:thioredoxin 1